MGYPMYGLYSTSEDRLVRSDEGANDMYIALVQQNYEQYDELDKKIRLAQTKLLHQPESRKYYLDQIDLLNKRKNKFRWFGYKGIDYKVNNQKYSYLKAEQERLNDMFIRKYGRYRIGYNSAIEFQNQLQFIFESVADHYEARFKVDAIYNKMFDEEAKDPKNGFGNKMVSEGTSDTTNDNKEAALPDVEENVPVYTHGSNQKANSTNKASSLDVSFLTKLSSISGYLTFDKYLARDYINEFMPLFQTLIW